MHASGPCPVCKNIVAYSAVACPKCGNTDFMVKTGKRLQYICKCEGTGTIESGSICSICHGKGLIYSDQIVDSRDPDRARQEFLDNQKTQSLDQRKISEARAKRAKRIEGEKQRNLTLSKIRKAEGRKNKISRFFGTFVMSVMVAVIGYIVVGFVGCVARIPTEVRQGPQGYAFQAYSVEAKFAFWTIIGIGILIAIVSLFLPADD